LAAVTIPPARNTASKKKSANHPSVRRRPRTT
jgi:hypothetical protein